MNRIRALLPLLLVLLAPGGAVRADDSFPINVYPCPKAATPPVVDGKLDDAVWQEAPLVSGFVVFETGEVAVPQTSFRLLWDDACLYLAVRCDEPLLSKLNPVRYPHDEHAVFGNEAVELFVDPNHTHDRYYQLAFDVAGSLYDGEREATLWDSRARVATLRGADYWSAELAVPWEALQATPQAGKVVGFNVNRDRTIGVRSWTTWARVLNGFHDPDRFAHLVLSGTAESIGGLTAEFRKGGRRGPLTVYSAAGLAETTYAKLAEAAFAEVEKRLASLDEVALREKDAAAAADIKQRCAACRAQLAGMQRQTAAALDAVVWTRLDIDLQAIMTQLSTAIGQARLKALLDRI